MDLLLNSLAIAFIFELDESIYHFLVPEETKRILSRLEPLKFSSSLPRVGYRALVISKFGWGVFIVPLLVGFQIHNHYSHTVQPVMAALNCACQKAGQTC